MRVIMITTTIRGGLNNPPRAQNLTDLIQHPINQLSLLILSQSRASQPLYWRLLN
jgi:hypothetical protein